MNKKILIMLFLGTILFISACTSNQTNTQITSNEISGGGIKEFNTEIKGFKYNPETINVNLGDSVRINIKNNDAVTHGISLPVFGVSSFVSPGQTTTIEFIADKTGNPETFCSTDHGEKLLIQVS